MDIYIAMEESYKNGYVKGSEDMERKLGAELEFTRKFIHDQGLEFELAAAWEKAGHPAMIQRRGRWIIHSSGKGDFANNWAECSECHVCGSPQWKRCPVCESKMEVAL